MGRFLPKKLIDFYEPRIHRKWLQSTGEEGGLSRRETMLLRLFFAFLFVAFLTTPYLHRWIAQQAPGGPITRMWRVHLHALGGTALFTALACTAYRLLPIFYERCRVRIRVTDQFIQRFHMSGGPVVFWKHAGRAVLGVVSFEDLTWAVLDVYTSKSTHPLRVGLPDDQPIEPILNVLADHGVPVEIVEQGARN